MSWILKGFVRLMTWARMSFKPSKSRSLLLKKEEEFKVLQARGVLQYWESSGCRTSVALTTEENGEQRLQWKEARCVCTIKCWWELLPGEDLALGPGNFQVQQSSRKGVKTVDLK